MAETQDVLRRMLGGQSGRAPIDDVEALADGFSRELAARLTAMTGEESAVATTVEAGRLSGGAGAGALFALARGFTGRLGAVAAFPDESANRLIEAAAGAVHGVGGGGGRRFTPIDLALAEPSAHALFSAFEGALGRRPGFDGGGRLRLDRFEQKFDEIIANHGDAEALVFSVEATLSEGESPVRISLIAAASTLDDYRVTPAQTAAPETTAADSAWGAAMRAAANSADIRLVGVLHQRALSVRDLKQLEPGAVIPLPRDNRLDVELRLDGPDGVAHQPVIGRGLLGGAEGWRAVRLDGPLAPELTEAVIPYAD